MRKKLKLLFVVTEDWFFVSHRLQLAVSAKNAGFEVSVATRVGQHGNIIEKAGIRLIPFEKTQKNQSIIKSKIVFSTYNLTSK